MEKTEYDYIPDLKKVQKKLQLEFDYEISNSKVDETEKVKTRLLSRPSIKEDYRILNYNNFSDSLEIVLPKVTNSPKKANCFKRLVSKKKRRFQNNLFDLDLAFLLKKGT